MCWRRRSPRSCNSWSAGATSGLRISAKAACARAGSTRCGDADAREKAQHRVESRLLRPGDIRWQRVARRRHKVRRAPCGDGAALSSLRRPQREPDLPRTPRLRCCHRRVRPAQTLRRDPVLTTVATRPSDSYDLKPPFTGARAGRSASFSCPLLARAALASLAGVALLAAAPAVPRIAREVRA